MYTQVCLMRLFPLSIIFCLLVSCHAQPKVLTADYTVSNTLDLASVHKFTFESEYALSMMWNQKEERVLDDTLFYIALSSAKDMLYVLNCYSGKLRTLSFDHLKKNGVISMWTFYYHNHDSIFLCLDRFAVAAINRRFHGDYKDIMLVNGKGELICRYSLDSLPDVYNETLQYGCHFPWDNHLDERLFAGGLLVDAVTKKPYVTEKGFSVLNPKVMALCMLLDGSLRMLNVRYPAEIHERKYDYPPEIWVKVMNGKELLVGFSVTPIIYRYDFESDTMTPLDARYDSTFLNTDSSSMVKGRDYPMALFTKPVWRASDACYVREVCFRHYKGYGRSQLVELLDSSFNHMGYVCADIKHGWYDIRCHANGSITVADKGGYARHAVTLTGKMRWTGLSSLERRSMVKTPRNQSGHAKSMRFSQVMQALQVPDSSVVIVINLKYPCGPCMEELANFYRNHRQTLEAHRVYYVYYDPETSDDASVRNIMKNYGVSDARNVRVDHKLLGRVTDVLPNGREAQYTQFLILDFRKNTLMLATPAFRELMAELERIVGMYENPESRRD